MNGKFIKYRLVLAISVIMISACSNLEHIENIEFDPGAGFFSKTEVPPIIGEPFCVTLQIHEIREHPIWNATVGIVFRDRSQKNTVHVRAVAISKNDTYKLQYQYQSKITGETLVLQNAILDDAIPLEEPVQFEMLVSKLNEVTISSKRFPRYETIIPFKIAIFGYIGASSLSAAQIKKLPCEPQNKGKKGTE